MNAEVIFRDDQGNSHKIKMTGFQNGGTVVTGWQKVGKSFIKRSIGAPEVTGIREIGKFKLREIANALPLRVMFRSGRVETIEAIKPHSTERHMAICVCRPEEEGEPSLNLPMEWSSPIEIIL